MIKNNIISVIVPIYNSENHLKICLDSIKKQTYKNIEVILVNDGSTDKSEKICLDLCNTDKRFRYYKKNNGGASSARNFGLKMSKGEFISFIDSDDYIELNMLEKMLKAIYEYDADITVCGRFKDYDKKIKTLHSSKKIKIFDSNQSICNMLANKNMDFSPCDKLFKRNLWENIFFPEGVTSEDMLVLPKVFFKASKIVHIGIPLYHYRYTHNSVTTSSFNQHTFDSLHAIEYFSKIYENGNFSEKLSLQAFKTIQYNFYLQKEFSYEGVNTELFTKYKDYLKNNLIFIILNPKIKFKTKSMSILLLIPSLYKKIYHRTKKIKRRNENE